jgi:sec-independent protein translocase protein TatB
MFDIGWSELLVIGIVALVVIGPKELPGVLRTVGQMVGKLRRMAGEFQGQFQEALREAELDGLKKSFTDFTEDANKSIAGALPSNPLLDIENEVKAATASIEGRKDEPATTVEDATAQATGIDAATAAVEAQLPKPEEPAPLEPYAFEDIVSGTAPEPLPAAQTTPVEARPLDVTPPDAKSAAVEPDAAARVAIEGAPADLFADDLPAAAPARPKRKPRVVTAPAEPEVSEAVAALDDAATTAEKPKRKPRVRAKTSADKTSTTDTSTDTTPTAGDEGPDAA